MYLKAHILSAIGFNHYHTFCKNVGISRFNFSKWINNHQKLSVVTLFKILNYLEVLSPEHNFLSIQKLTTDDLLDLYKNRDKLENIFKALEKLENDNPLPKYLQHD